MTSPPRIALKGEKDIARQNSDRKDNIHKRTITNNQFNNSTDELFTKGLYNYTCALFFFYIESLKRLEITPIRLEQWCPFLGP